MSEDLTNQTRLNLATAKDAYRQALAKAELLEIEVLEARQASELAAAKASRLSKVLQILDSDYVPEPAPVAATTSRGIPEAPQAAPQPAPVEAGGSVADQIAAAAAAGDEMANRTVDGGGYEDRDAPPPANRPAQGPACPGCGTPGSMVQSQIMVGDRGPFPAIVCTHCGHQKAMI